jgi:uncharacterized protein (TIGR03067 family)
MFDEKSLDGWTQRNGTATYRIENNTIVGQTTDESPNSFLCSDKLYGNFELFFEVKVDNQLNSGVQIRSTTKDGKPKGRVNGPQVEIEASGAGGAEAGYLYGEAAGGWMTPEADLKPHKHFKDGDWNKFRVLAVGANIKVWINDELISDLTDEAKLKSHPKGFIGLQVHGIGKGQGPYEVAWRNLKIREISARLELSKIIGDWTYVRGQADGVDIGEERLVGLTTITDKTLTLTGDNAKFVFEYEIDTEKTPTAIKLTMTESSVGSGAEANGIIRMSGEQLELCYAIEGGAAPTRFEAPENSNHRYLVMKKKEK